MDDGDGDVVVDQPDVVLGETGRGYRPGEACGSGGLSPPHVSADVDMEAVPDDEVPITRGVKRSSTTPMTTLDPRATDGPAGEEEMEDAVPILGFMLLNVDRHENIAPEAPGFVADDETDWKEAHGYLVKMVNLDKSG